MSGTVYISGIHQDGDTGDRQGPGTEYLGENWEPAKFKVPLSPKRAE